MIEAHTPEMGINSEPAVLVCLITGYPRPNITWEKNGEVFTDSARINIFDFEVGAMDSGNSSDIGYMSIANRFNDSGSIGNLLRLEILFMW